MRELDLVKEILDKILAEADLQGAKQIKLVEVVLGQSFPLSPKDLKYWITELARGTPAEKARFSIKKGKVKGSAYVLGEIEAF